MVTGMFAGVIFISVTVLDGLFLTPASALPLMLVILIAGFVVGISVLWPLFYLCSFIGLMLAVSQPWARNRAGWALTGAGIGGVLLTVLVLAQSEALPLLFFSPYGAVCGGLAGMLCHRWIGVEKLFTLDPQ
jgi:hypothetical protein